MKSETNIKVKHLLPQILQPSSVASLGRHPAEHRWVLKWCWISVDTDILPKQKQNEFPNSHDSSFVFDLRSFLFFKVIQKLSVYIPPLAFLFTGSKFWNNPSLQFQLGFDPSKGWCAVVKASLSTAVATIHHGLRNGTYLQCPKHSKLEVPPEWRPKKLWTTKFQIFE